MPQISIGFSVVHKTFGIPKERFSVGPIFYVDEMVHKQRRHDDAIHWKSN